jgi:threonine dehydrogenase-like Zn-dependent dehydrogenase
VRSLAVCLVVPHARGLSDGSCLEYGRAGACQALSPQDLPSVPRFDVSIEVSGNPAGLQSALDRTMPGGCVVIGSWYSDVASLSLGAPFHRGRIRLKTSQVSFVPAALCDRWDKARRFAATWALLRELRPARLLRAQCMSHHKAQAAYELLDRGERLCILLKY